MDRTKVVLALVALQAATLLLPQRAATGDFLAPLSAPIMNATCDHVECGKETCKASLDYTFGFICECNQGWSQFHIERRNHPHHEIKLVRYDAKDHSQKRARQQAPISLSLSFSLLHPRAGPSPGPFMDSALAALSHFQSSTTRLQVRPPAPARSRFCLQLKPLATTLASNSSSLPVPPPALASGSSSGL